MAALICIKVIHGTFWQLFNIANRFLRVFVSLVVPIKNIFPGGVCTMEYDVNEPILRDFKVIVIY